MPRILGQFLRFSGLLIEMLGFWALAFRSGTDVGGGPLPGSYSPRLVWSVIGLGFAIWLVGTMLNFWARAGNDRSAGVAGKYDIQL